MWFGVCRWYKAKQQMVNRFKSAVLVSQVYFDLWLSKTMPVKHKKSLHDLLEGDFEISGVFKHIFLSFILKQQSKKEK